MSDPTIKRETNREPSLTAIPSRSIAGPKTSFLTIPSSSCDSIDDAKPPPPKPSPGPHTKPLVQVNTEDLPAAPYHVIANPAIPTQATYEDSSPPRHKIGGSSVADGHKGAHTRSVKLLLSSRPDSALATQQQNIVNTKTQPGHHTLAACNLLRLDHILGARIYTPPPSTRHIARAAVMDEYDIEEYNEAVGGGEAGVVALNTYTQTQVEEPQTVTLSRVEFDLQQHYVQNLQSSNMATQRTLEKQDVVIGELVAFNHNMHSAMRTLEARLTQLERGNAQFLAPTASETDAVHADRALTAKTVRVHADDDCSVPEKNEQAFNKASAKRPVADAFTTEGLTMPGRTKYRKKLEVKIPGKIFGGSSGVGLPTPMASAVPTAPPSAVVPITPRTPYTPGRIGPPESYKKTTTSINKREIHNLNKSIPPVHAHLPLVPLTDTEVIVYFFNSLSRPIVSLRLYARGWGPASIVQALNDHREVDPPYLRNTCSVKCTTAIKAGKRQWGDEWEEFHRAILAEADDSRATDIIRDADDDNTVDYDVRALCANLKKHPSGEDAGIFSECVQYCAKHNAPYTLHNVWKLAMDLHQGNLPQHPASPVFSDATPDQRTRKRTGKRKQKKNAEENLTDDEASSTPSPTVERKPAST